MKKIIAFILTAISILSISIFFTGCGTQTVNDITGEYIWIENGKEKEETQKNRLRRKEDSEFFRIVRR